MMEQGSSDLTIHATGKLFYVRMSKQMIRTSARHKKYGKDLPVQTRQNICMCVKASLNDGSARAIAF